MLSRFCRSCMRQIRGLIETIVGGGDILGPKTIEKKQWRNGLGAWEVYEKWLKSILGPIKMFHHTNIFLCCDEKQMQIVALVD